MSEDDFLSRWSRRKRATPSEETRKPEPETEQMAEPQTEEEENELLTRLDLPAPESLEAGDDFSRFMADGVPEFLRKRALRVLWRSNPVLANLDGLNDYDEDFTSPELTQKVLATSYKVGRGFLAKITEETQAPKATPTEPDQDPVDEDTREPTVKPDEFQTEHTTSLEEENEGPVLRPRRMRFEAD